MVDRVVFCDEADVRAVTATLRAIGLGAEVRVWETPNNGAVAYIRLDTLRELAGGDHARRGAHEPWPCVSVDVFAGLVQA